MIFPDKEPQRIFDETNSIFDETSNLVDILSKENSKVSKKLDETWTEIKKIKGNFTRDEYLQVLTKFSDQILINTPIIDESLSNIYAKINTMQNNVQRMKHWSYPFELQTFESKISNLKSVVDIEVKKNELNNSRFVGISNYLDTIQRNISDRRMEKIAKEQHDLSLSQHSISKTQLYVAIAVGFIAGITLFSSISFSIDTGNLLDQINQRQDIIANTPPYVRSDAQNIVLPVIIEDEDKVFPSKILITPLGDHPLRIHVLNATMKNNSGVSCFFDEKPTLSLSGTWLTTMRSDEINSPVYVLIQINYTPKDEFKNLNMTEQLTEVKIAWMEYTISVKDIQNNKEVIIHPNAWITTFLPNEFVENNWHCSR